MDVQVKMEVELERVLLGEIEYCSASMPPPPLPASRAHEQIPLCKEGNMLVADYFERRVFIHKLLCLGLWCDYDSEDIAYLKRLIAQLDMDTRCANARYLSSVCSSSGKVKGESDRLEVVRHFAARMRELYIKVEPVSDFCIDVLDLNSIDELLCYVSQGMTQERAMLVRRMYSLQYKPQMTFIRKCRGIVRACRTMCVPIADKEIAEKYETLMVSVMSKFADDMNPSPYLITQEDSGEGTASSSDSGEEEDDAAYAAHMFADIMDCVTMDVFDHLDLEEDESFARELYCDMRELAADCMLILKITSAAKLYEVTSSVTSMRQYWIQTLEEKLRSDQRNSESGAVTTSVCA